MCHANTMVSHPVCCILLFYPSSKFTSGERDELIWKEEHGEWKIEKKKCRINSDPHFITLATTLTENEKILWSRMTHPQVTQFWEPLRSLSRASVINGKHIYKLFPFPKSQRTAFHTKLTVKKAHYSTYRWFITPVIGERDSNALHLADLSDIQHQPTQI